jgi:hypothetical protein
MLTYRDELPELFKGVAPLESLLDVSRVVSPIKIYLGDDPSRAPLGKRRFRYSTFINKGYCYFPQPPKVENGHILNADYSSLDQAYTRPGLRVFDSLNEYPPDWKRGECVLKQIDDHWFISMCRAAN